MVKISLKAKRWKLLTAGVICLIVLAVAAVLLERRQVAEAAMIEPVYEGLVGWWRFDEGEGNIAKDSSGNANDGTIYGATWVDGKYGKALSFDGIDDYVAVPHSSSLDLVNAFTVSVWVKYNDLSQPQVILWKGTGYNPTYGLGTLFEGNGFRYWLTKNGGRYGAALIPIKAGVWNHVVYTYDGSTLKCYLNSVDTNVNTAVSAPLTSYAQSLLIGKRLVEAYCPFNGIIDEVRIYNRALSQTEINELYQKTPDYSSKLLAKIPKGTTQVIVTAMWQGTGSLNATIIRSSSEIYTEDMLPVYQKTRYSTSGGASEMLNIKRLSISVPALSSDENWYITLDLDNVEEYTITVEIQK